MIRLTLDTHEMCTPRDMLVAATPSMDSSVEGGDVSACCAHIMFTPDRDFLLETPWRIIIPNPKVNSHSR
jgi:hypothetical protein